MKVIFVINTFLFRMRVKANWNLPHLPRIGERISPHVIMFQEEFTYHNVLKYLTDEAKMILINSMIMRVIWKEILKHGYMMSFVRLI